MNYFLRNSIDADELAENSYVVLPTDIIGQLQEFMQKQVH